MSRAWLLLDDDLKLGTALTTWHQGMLLSPLFPSFAMIAFCSAVEAVAESELIKGRIRSRPTRCGACGTVVGAHARFWETVGLVRDEAAVADLRDGHNPYGRRSRTAHGGGVHGIESIFGYAQMLLYNPSVAGGPPRIAIDEADPTQHFMWKELPAIRSVASALLLEALASER